MASMLENRIASAIWNFDEDDYEYAQKLASSIVKAVEKKLSRRTQRAADSLKASENSAKRKVVKAKVSRPAKSR